MFSAVRRGRSVAAALVASTVLVGTVLVGTVLASGGLAAPAVALASSGASSGESAAALVPRNDPTITIRVGGVRTAENGPPGPPAASGLAGVTFRVTPASAGHPETCVSTAAGRCTLHVSANRTYTITQVGTPSGWFASPSLAAGTLGQTTPRAYDTLSVKVGTGNVTIPAAAPNSDTSPTARGGTWALSRDNPALPEGCGLRIALLIDLSSSISQTLLPTYKAAARAFVGALKGTPSSIAIYTFGTTGPASGVHDANLAPVSVATQAGVTTLVNKINGLTVPSGAGTNWDAGFWQIVRDNPTYHYQSTVILTDGDPTYYGPSGNLGGSGTRTRFAEIENGIFSANALKAAGTTVLSVGIGTSSRGLRYTDNIRAVSGPVKNKDYFNTDFARLSTLLAELALRNCAGLDLTKTASPATYTRVGQRITYTYTVTNPKYFRLHDVHVTDDRINGPVACVPSTLATGETATCAATYRITQADLDAGHITNTATATGTTPNHDDVISPPARETVHARQAPAIRLVKTAFPVRYAVPGEQISYTYTVTNTGNVTLHGITLTDNRLGTLPCPVTTLAPDEATTCTAQHTTTQADVNAGHIVNSATATGRPPTGRRVTDTDTAVVKAIHTPGIQLRKSAYPDSYAAAGEKITYTYKVTNTGNVTLRDVTVHDDRLGAIDCPLTRLAPGRSMTCHAEHTTTQADVEAGHITNSAVAKGHPPTGPPVTDTGTAVVNAIHTPGIDLNKTASPARYTAAGEQITYSYKVTNTGNVTLRDVTVHDDRLGAIDCPLTRLAAGRSMTCHAEHTITQADVDAGHIANLAVAAGQPPAGPPVTADATERVTATSEPGIDLAKTASPARYTAAGEQITYSYTVTNTGNVTLRDVTVADDRLGAIDCPLTRLAPDRSMTCEAVYYTTQADVDAGQIVNAAVAAGQSPAGPPVTADATERVTATPEARIKLVKTAFPAQYSAPDEQITYTYTVTNTGNVTLHAVTVTDNQLGVITCGLRTLAPGESMTCAAVYTTTQVNVDAGRIVNAAIVTGEPPTGPPVIGGDTEVVAVIHEPAVELHKTAFPARYGAAGEQITYTYTVTNTGNVTLQDITVADDRLGAVPCLATWLAPGESTTCEAVYMTTQADVDAGRIVNAATVTGEPPTGPQVSDDDTATVAATHQPGIQVEKMAFPVQYAAAGERITYAYTVTNVGNVTLRNVAVHDDQLGIVHCPATTLVPGESMSCAAVYPTTQADVDAGRIVNTAIVTGQPPTGPPVSDGDTATVEAIHAPGIGLEKSPSRTTFSAAGQKITYTYLVVNTGNATLHEITVTDSSIHGPVACAATVLPPGASTTCRASYVTTLADVAAGQVINIAAATGTPSAGARVTAEAEAIVTATLPVVPVTG
jgi:uncharacterized membrane protein